MTWAEDWLRERHTEATAAESAVIAVILSRPGDLLPVYDAIARQCEGPAHRCYVLDALVYALAVSRPETLRRMAEAHDEAERLDNQIADKLAEISKLFEQRSHLRTEYVLSGADDYHVADWIAAGLAYCDADTAGRFRLSLMPKLEALQRQYDLQYWPSPSHVLRAIADAQAEGTQSANPAVRAGLQGYQGAAATLRAVLHEIDAIAGVMVPPDNNLPPEPIPPLKLTDDNLSRLLIAAGIETSAESVKKTRQRLQREGDISPR